MERCLEGLLGQDLPAHDYEIVVVDNGSTDGTYEFLASAAAHSRVPMRVVVDHGSLGAIRNRAVGEARTPFVAFVDSDCVPSPGWLAAGLAAFDDRHRLGVVQGLTIPDPTIPQGRWSATQDLESFTDRYEACNIFYLREALVAGGGFDEKIGQFGEDTAAGWRVRRLGWDAAFEPEAVVTHTVTHPGLGWHLRRGFGYGAINALVRQFPEMRENLWHGIFLRPSSAAFAGATAGLLLTPFDRRALALAAPYAWMRRPKRLRRRAILDAATAVAWDASIFGGMVRGSVKTRTLVL